MTIESFFVFVIDEIVRITGVVYDVFFAFRSVLCDRGLFDVSQFFFDEFVGRAVAVGVDCACDKCFNSESGGVVFVLKFGL